MSRKFFFCAVGAPPSVLTFAPMNFGGGGFVRDIHISPDGLTKTVSTDVGGYGGWIFDTTTDKWQGLFNLANWGSSGTCLIARSAPSNSNIIYAVNLESNNGAILKSTDRSGSWNATGSRVSGYNRPGWINQGPTLAIDPNDPNHIIFINYAGVVFRSIDGGATKARITNLDAAYQLTAIAEAASSGVTSFTVDAVPAAVQSLPTYLSGGTNLGINRLFPFDLDNEDVFQDEHSYRNAATATVISLPSAGPTSAAITAGDTIIFGVYGSVVFDPTSGTDANGRTKGIYVGFGYGADGVYHSDDAGDTFSNLSAVDGPTQVGRLEMSSDGVLYAAEFTAAPGQKVWRYQSGTWTTIFTAGDANWITGLASDPNNPGTILLAYGNGSGISWSIDYGANFSGSKDPTRAAGDNPWIVTYRAANSLGSIAFDPVVEGRLWYVNGFGIFHSDTFIPANYPGNGSTAWSWTATAKTLNNNELIANSIKKLPNGGPIIWGGEDVSGFVLTSDDAAPEKCLDDYTNWGFAISLSQGTDVDYAKDDPTFVIMVGYNYVMKSANSGIDWDKCTRPDDPGQGGALACQTSLNFVYFPANNGRPHVTDDGGTTMTYCLFDGVEIDQDWAFANYLYRLNVCADLVNPNKYYAASYADYRFYLKPDYLTIADPSSGYTAGDSLTVVGGTGNAGKIIVDTVDGSGAITAAHVDPTTPGSYTAAPTFPASVTGGTGSGATFDNVGASCDAGTTSYDGTSVLLNEGGTVTGEFAVGQVLQGAPNTGYRITAQKSPGVWRLNNGVVSGTPTTYKGVCMNQGGLWTSEDGGFHWSQTRHSMPTGSNANARQSLVAVPGHEGHLLLSSGYSNKYCAFRSINGGLTWYPINSTSPAGSVVANWGHQIAVGKAAPGASYPAVYMWGEVGGELGIWVTEDMDPTDPTVQPTWQLLVNRPLNSPDYICNMWADYEVYRKLYLGFFSTGGMVMKLV